MRFGFTLTFALVAPAYASDLLRREVNPHDEDPHVENHKIEREAAWAERIERHEENRHEENHTIGSQKAKHCKVVITVPGGAGGEADKSVGYENVITYKKTGCNSIKCRQVTFLEDDEDKVIFVKMVKPGLSPRCSVQALQSVALKGDNEVKIGKEFYSYIGRGGKCDDEKTSFSNYVAAMKKIPNHGDILSGAMNSNWKFECVDGAGENKATIMRYPTAVRRFKKLTSAKLGGQVTDASDPSIGVSGAKVTAKYKRKSIFEGGEKTLEATSGADGTFEFDERVDLDTDVALSATHENFEPSEQTFTFIEKTTPGGLADISMSKRIPKGQNHRFVFKWSDDGSDMDIEATWGDKRVYFSHMEVGTEGDGTLHVKLENDEMHGRGPETLYLSNTDKCEGDACTFKIKFNLYRGNGEETTSGVITWFKGDGTHEKFEVSATPGQGDCHPSTCFKDVVEFDGKTGAKKPKA